MTLVFKILSPEAWAKAGASGTVPPAEVDTRDGYIHLSAADQVAQTLALHFTSAGSVVLVAFEADALGVALKWEASRGGALFPHLYGPLEATRALKAWTLARGTDGAFGLPDDFG